ncbi:Predicted nucleotide-binding protein [Bordetella ansorpii]|uniref:Predicted nucleotide-binding protein n=1 Tax=Bordetella ansorpii TaxID=288768 RepID=A0A157SJK4_9BORD|nr:PIN domain-containing protein [Bordetella ansorpii]SAI70383.1 Predicted nucleotide-binding protein [Bordetella ansorpii]
MRERLIVLDANILIRATLGQRVRRILAAYEPASEFLTPNTAYDEVRKHLPGLMSKRGAPARRHESMLDTLTSVTIVDRGTYASACARAQARINHRDPDDWPVLACALAHGYPIWTEDRDFFGTGVATWTTDRIELFVNESGVA